MMEETIKILIYIHAFFGGIGLITGVGSIITKKGSVLHKKMGKLFSIGMMTSSLISIPISWMPNHENLFLFLIGLFTIYLVLAGNRVLKYKRKTKPEMIDKIISGSMFVFSFIMVALGGYNLTIDIGTGILYVFFGGFGLFFTIIDFRFYRNPRKARSAYLVSHIRKMVGAFIASVTAFFVAGLGFMNLLFWILPSVLGTGYIVFWRRKVQGKTVANKT
jgi:uncharacterized membrane protein